MRSYLVETPAAVEQMRTKIVIEHILNIGTRTKLLDVRVRRSRAECFMCRSGHGLFYSRDFSLTAVGVDTAERHTFVDRFSLIVRTRQCHSRVYREPI